MRYHYCAASHGALTRLHVSAGDQLVIVFRGTETTKEWVENATMTLEQLDDEPPESGFALFFNNKVKRRSIFTGT